MTMQSTEERPAAHPQRLRLHRRRPRSACSSAVGPAGDAADGADDRRVVLAVLSSIWCFAGLYMLQPNQAALLLLFGSYRGTDRER